MRVLIKSVKIIDPRSPYHQDTKDISIVDGVISQIEDHIESTADKIIDADQWCISPSWIDIHTTSGEPGFEHREDFDSLTLAATRGGYSRVAIAPHTLPVVDSSAVLNAIIKQPLFGTVKIEALAAISKDLEHLTLAEIYDMSERGALGFSSFNPIKNDAFMIKALQYMQPTQKYLFHSPHDAKFIHGAQIHESQQSVQMGMKGLPHLSETLLMKRDLDLVEYYGGKLAWLGVSSKESAKIFKQAHESKPDLALGISYWHLIMNEKEVFQFNTQAKFSPPLREKDDQKALLDLIEHPGVFLYSQHMPWEDEKKKLEFSFAAFGASGIETAFAAFNSFINREDKLSIWVEKTAHIPRKLLNLVEVTIEEQQTAEFTLYDPAASFELKEGSMKSKSKNNPLIGREMKGLIKAKIFGNQIEIL